MAACVLLLLSAAITAPAADSEGHYSKTPRFPILSPAALPQTGGFFVFPHPSHDLTFK